MDFLCSKTAHLKDVDDDLQPFSQDGLKMSLLTDIRNNIPLFDDFSSDEENFPSLQIDLNYNDSDYNDESEQELKNGAKKNRRKASTPQRAVQPECNFQISESGFCENTSESSQDMPTKSLSIMEGSTSSNDNFKPHEISNIPEHLFDISHEDSDNFLDTLTVEDIFKDFKEETQGEPLDSDFIDNVKEEWKAHWGVKCNMCEVVFPYKAEFDVHYRLNYSLYPVYTCTVCNKSFEKYSTFRSHCYRHITEGRYKCQECSKGFNLQSLLHVHILAKHTRAKPFMCEECGKSFVTKPGLKIHLRKHKTEIKEDYPCVECGKVLHTRGGLTSHMNVHRMGRRFMCDLCGKTFTQKVNMQQHVKQHTGDKPYACDKCEKTFSERSHLNRHYSLHSDKRPFKCSTCQKMYKTERCLKVHSLVHAAERPFICKYCNKGFLSSTKLKQHYNIHTGERPYKCKYCERTFTNYPNWLKHIRRRHKVDHKTGANLNPPQDKKLKKVAPKPEPTVKTEIKQEAGTLTSPPIISVPNNPQPQSDVVDTLTTFGNNQLISTDVTLVKAGLRNVKTEIKQEAGLLTSPPIISVPNNSQPQSDVVDTLTFGNDQLISDVTLAKAEELLLQQGLLNVPFLEDKVLGHQTNEILASTSGSNYLIPYFQTSLPLPNQAIIQSSPNLIMLPIQISDLIATNFVQPTGSI